MKTVSMVNEIIKFPGTINEYHTTVQRANWEKHNAARNVAHADYKNPDYIKNRMAADRIWMIDSDEIVTAFSKVVDYIKKSEVVA